MAAGSTRRTTSSYYSPALPIRRSSAAAAPSSSAVITPPSSPPTSATSPIGRKPLDSFAAFSPTRTTDVFKTAVEPTGGLFGKRNTFSGVRDRGAGGGLLDEDDEDGNDGRQRIELRTDSITLDQVRS